MSTGWHVKCHHPNHRQELFNTISLPLCHLYPPWSTNLQSNMNSSWMASLSRFYFNRQQLLLRLNYSWWTYSYVCSSVFVSCQAAAGRRRMSSSKVKSRHLITTIINYYYRHVRHLICINYNNGLCTRLIKFVLLITIKVSSSIDKSRVHNHQPWPCYRRRGWHGDCDKGDIRTNVCLVASCHWMASLSAILLRVFVLDGTKPQELQPWPSRE